MKLWISVVIWFIIVTLFSLFLITFAGCCGEWQKKFIDASREITKLKEQLATTPTQIVYKTVTKQDWLVTVSIIGIGLSVFAFLSGRLWGLKSIAALWSVLSLVLMLQRFAMWIAVMSFIGAIGLMVFVIWQNRKVLTEIVAGGEKFKTMLTPIGQPTATGPIVDSFKDAHNTEQSNTTKQVVANIQTKLNGKET